MKISGIILTLLISACGHYSTDPAFESYVSEFRNVLKAQGVPEYAQRWNIELRFGTPTVSIEAECRSGDVQGEVIIDREMWGTLRDIDRRVLIFHELGHCVLGRKHNPSAHETTDGHLIPESLMFPNATTAANEYARNPEPYNIELTQGLAF